MLYYSYWNLIVKEVWLTWQLPISTWFWIAFREDSCFFFFSQHFCMTAANGNLHILCSWLYWPCNSNLTAVVRWSVMQVLVKGCSGWDEEKEWVRLMVANGGGGGNQLKKVFVSEGWGLLCVWCAYVCVMGDGLCVMKGAEMISTSGVWVGEK